MADENATNLEVIRLRRAAFYPQTQSGTPRPATTPATPDEKALRRRQRDNPSPPENVAKPWKKPWDK
jgi:hypothetical protein